MNLAGAVRLAAAERLYPSLVLHGGDAAARLAGAGELARALLCAAEPAARPCGVCAHCGRIELPGGEQFHPDLHVLSRDLKTSTSVEATRTLVRACQQSPFEARGQVLVVAEAETLTAEAANALLKVLEEPPARAPRHFLLLARSEEDLLPTLRSRSWAVWLGSPTRLEPALTEPVAEAFAAALAGFSATGSPVDLLAAAAALAEAGGFEDLRAQRPWAVAASGVVAAARSETTDPELRRRLLALASDLLDEAPQWRLRAISAQRILEGLVARHLAGGAVR